MIAFLENKYTKWYFGIINSAQQRTEIKGYFEKHHIIPKSLGDDNSKKNLVCLTAREHFICHWLLTKMLNDENLLKMKRALWRMLVNGADFQDRYKPNSRTYQNLRLKYGSLRKGIKTSENVKNKIAKSNKGKTAWNKGVPRTTEEKIRMSLKRKETAKKVGTWNQGKFHSSTTIYKMKEKAKDRKKYACPHCSKSMAGSNYFRWHGNNCKFLIDKKETACLA